MSNDCVSLDLTASLDEKIKIFGFSIVSVFSDGESPGFSYTVGLTETYRHPEIIVFGLPQTVAASLFHSIVDTILDEGVVIETDVSYTKLANLPLEFSFVGMERAEPYMLACSARYHEDFAVLQMLWPDKSGHMPYDVLFDFELKKTQPVLSETI